MTDQMATMAVPRRFVSFLIEKAARWSGQALVGTAWLAIRALRN